ncbi:MAG TPA: glycosyltransferase [Verrucomicrobiae bacterium]|jgi:hypothetical protein|nr:glycosyltransferase [Verrucomicrobiae bacterium]
MNSNQNPLVTVVVVPRESFNMAHDCVQRILDVTTVPFKMLVMEGHAPEFRRKQLEAIAAKHPNIKIVPSNRWKFPHEMVNESMAMIDTKYVLYIDNDVEVFEGCVENLVKTAEECQVDCVHPIYLTTKLNDPRGNIIHVAEGTIVRKQQPDGKMFLDSLMTFSGTKLEEYPYKEARPSEYFEWHAVLFSKKLLDKVGPLDDLMISEHLDYTFRLQEAGFRILLEPKSVGAYQYDRIWDLRGADRDYMIFRWNPKEAERSLKLFAKKWNLEEGSISRRLYWCKEHVGKVKSTRLHVRMLNKVRRLAGKQNLPWVEGERFKGELKPDLPADLKYGLTSY